MSAIFVRLASFIRNLRQVRQYMMDEAAILAAIAMVSSHLDCCNSLLRSLSSFNMCKLQRIQNTLGRFVTNCNRYSQASPILKNSNCCQLSFAVFSRLPLWFISFFTRVIQAILFPLLSIYCRRYGTRYNHPDKRFLKFLNTSHLHTNPKQTLVTVLPLMLQSSGVIYLMMFVLSQLLLVSYKAKILCL